MDNTNTLILALESAGMPSKTVRLLQLAAVNLYCCFEKSLALTAYVEQAYIQANTVTLIQKVDASLSSQIYAQKIELTSNLKAVLIESGCDNVKEIGEAFLKDLQEIDLHKK